jgi:hypothetical protein
VPHANRVDPYGRLHATTTRGLFFGNRGVLHRPDGAITRRRTSERRWRVCVTEFKGRRRPLLRPGHYTELFFLDEAVALAAGHRPCVECRRASFVAYLAALGEPELRASGLDRRLDAERWRPEPLAGRPDGLPDGTFVDDGQRPLLVAGGRLRPWTPAGYEAAVAPDAATYRLLTPPTSLQALAGGYPAVLHPTSAT